MKLAVHGRSVFGPYATLRINSAKIGEKTRVAFITSTKVMKLAVDRNRAKRRMREVLRGLMADIPEGFSLLFVLKPECKDVPYEKLVEEVKRLLSKIPDAMKKPPKPSSRGKKFTTKMSSPKK